LNINQLLVQRYTGCASSTRALLPDFTTTEFTEMIV